MTMALENNRDIEVERLNVQMNEFDLRAAQGFYDPTWRRRSITTAVRFPPTSIFASGKTDNVIGTATFTQRTPWQGSSVTGVFDNNRATTDNPFNSSIRNTRRT